ncbi:MAG TPA: hypothetical protein VHA11_04895 [Bryobacteraceae bacterium]|nr:hypothetical protein [Bryobacteraceae bacterium]
MPIADIRLLVEDLSLGTDNTDVEELTRHAEWLREHTQEPRPDGRPGMVVNRDIKCAAEALQALIQAYQKQDWVAIKRHARVVHQALS